MGVHQKFGGKLTAREKKQIALIAQTTSVRVEARGVVYEVLEREQVAPGCVRLKIRMTNAGESFVVIVDVV